MYKNIDELNMIMAEMKQEQLAKTYRRRVTNDGKTKEQPRNNEVQILVKDSITLYKKKKTREIRDDKNNKLLENINKLRYGNEKKQSNTTINRISEIWNEEKESEYQDNSRREDYIIIVNECSIPEHVRENYDAVLNVEGVIKPTHALEINKARELRPIALTNVSHKLYMASIKDEIEGHLKDNNAIENSQARFTEGERIGDNIFILEYMVEETLKMIRRIGIELQQLYEEDSAQTVEKLLFCEENIKNKKSVLQQMWVKREKLVKIRNTKLKDTRGPMQRRSLDLNLNLGG
ncbi:uncharacterized protein [Palaemon carinicauda]|uniref:uncharacterized protein n=1 Tax=Palaemon carinicauda TaxID=392227 RepID=UPI0035B60BF8